MKQVKNIMKYQLYTNASKIIDDYRLYGRYVQGARNFQIEKYGFFSGFPALNFQIEKMFFFSGLPARNFQIVME